MKKFGNENFSVVGVNGEFTFREFHMVMHDEDLGFRAFYDGQEAPIARKWDVGYPSAFLIDHNGIIQSAGFSASTEQEVVELEKIIARLVNAAQ